MTKKELKKLMLEILSEQDNEDRDEWYATDYIFVKFGLGLLAERLGIELDKEDND